MTTLLALIALFAADQQPKADPGQVRCEVQVILATSGAPDVAQELRPLKRYLENSFGNRYSRFEHLATHNVTLGRDQRGGVGLPNATQLGLTYLGTEDGLIRVTMDVGGLKTQVKVHDGGLFFQAGRRFRDGMLVVAIRVASLE